MFSHCERQRRETEIYMYISIAWLPPVCTCTTPGKAMMTISSSFRPRKRLFFVLLQKFLRCNIDSCLGEKSKTKLVPHITTLLKLQKRTHIPGLICHHYTMRSLFSKRLFFGPKNRNLFKLITRIIVTSDEASLLDMLKWIFKSCQRVQIKATKAKEGQNVP